MRRFDVGGGMRGGWLEGWSTVAIFIALAGCGGSREPEPVVGSAGAEEPAQRATFHGTWNGARYDAHWVALAWQWPEGWGVFLSDRGPNEGEVGLPVGATYVQIRLGDAREPAAVEPGRQMTPTVVVAPNRDGSITPYEGEASATITLEDVRFTSAFDPEGSMPQTVGSATLEIDATFGADASHREGSLRGRGTIPIVFLGTPHVACRDAQPPATDFTWTETPDLRQIPAAPVHGDARGHAFTPASIFFERRMGRNGEEWSLVMSTEPSIGVPGIEHETLTVRFDRAPRRGRSTRTLASGGGYWQVCVGLGTTSWNADNGYAMEITRWQTGRCTPGEDGGPARLGTASGRIALVYRGTSESERGWVAGRFENVPIVTPSCE